MILRSLDQRLDAAEEGLKEISSSMARMQQQMNTHFSVFRENMTQIFAEHLKQIDMAFDIVLKKTEPGNNYTPPPPPSPPSPPPLSPPPLGFKNRSEGASMNIEGSNQGFRKLKMPLFNGNNSDFWIIEAERYFSFYQLFEDDKLHAVVVALEDDALLWYEWEHRRRPIRDWEELKGLIRRRFRCSQQSPATFQVRTEHKTAPLKEITEEVTFLGHDKEGLRNNNWAKSGVLGSHDWNHKMGTMKVKEKLSSCSIKSTLTTVGPESATTPTTCTYVTPLPIYTQSTISPSTVAPTGSTTATSASPNLVPKTLGFNSGLPSFKNSSKACSNGDCGAVFKARNPSASPAIKTQPLGTVDKKHETKILSQPSHGDLVLFYNDPQGSIQGPFTGTDILKWFEAGYFERDLQVRLENPPRDSTFALLGEVMPHLHVNARQPPEFTPAKESQINDESTIPSLISSGKRGENYLMEDDPRFQNESYHSGGSYDKSGLYVRASGKGIMRSLDQVQFKSGIDKDKLKEIADKEKTKKSLKINECEKYYSGRGNRGTHADDITQETEDVMLEGEKNVVSDKPPTEKEPTNEKKENAANESEDKEMTLNHKVLEGKRKPLGALKREEMKMEVGKELVAMQQLFNQKTNDDIFVKLGHFKSSISIFEKKDYEKHIATVGFFNKIDTIVSPECIDKEEFQQGVKKISTCANILLLAFKKYATMETGSIAVAGPLLDSFPDLMDGGFLLSPAKILEVFPVVMCPEDGGFVAFYCFNALNKPWFLNGSTTIIPSNCGSREVIISMNVLSGIIRRIIKLKCLLLSEVTWENQNTFPFFHLEDKVNLWGWGIATHPFKPCFIEKGKMGINCVVDSGRAIWAF